MAAVTSEVIWLTSLLAYLNVKVPQPVKLLFDSMFAIHISKNLVFHERTKHIEIDCHFIREKVFFGMIQLESINTKEQIADLFTKALHPDQFKYLVGKLSICNIYIQLKGEYQDRQTCK